MCSICEVGRWSGSGADSCTACDAGKSSDAGSAACDSCAGGTFSRAGSHNCTQCGSGLYSSTGASQCIGCDAGKHSDSGSPTCDACHAGTWSDASASSCEACAAGSYSNAGLSICTACDEGKHSNASAASCESCGAGSYAANTASTRCEECPKGKYSKTTGASECEDAAESYFCPETGMVAPHKCTAEVGTEYSSSGGTSECDECIDGYYMIASGTCKECPLGATCTEGTTLETMSVDEGQYRFEIYSTVVYACPVPENCVGGQYNLNDTNPGCLEGATGALCFACMPGYHRKEGMGCVVCSVTKGSWTFSIVVLVVMVVIGGIVYVGKKRIIEFQKVRVRNKLAEVRACAISSGRTNQASRTTQPLAAAVRR